MTTYADFIKQAADDKNLLQKAWTAVSEDPNMGRNLGLGGVAALLASIPGKNRSALNRVLSAIGGFAGGYGSGLGYDAWKNSQSAQTPAAAAEPPAAEPAAAAEPAPAKEDAKPKVDGNKEDKSDGKKTPQIKGLPAVGVVAGGYAGWKTGRGADVKAKSNKLQELQNTIDNTPAARHAWERANGLRDVVGLDVVPTQRVWAGGNKYITVDDFDAWKRAGGLNARKLAKRPTTPRPDFEGQAAAAKDAYKKLWGARPGYKNRIRGGIKGTAAGAGIGLLTQLLANKGLDKLYGNSARAGEAGGFSGIN